MGRVRWLARVGSEPVAGSANVDTWGRGQVVKGGDFALRRSAMSAKETSIQDNVSFETTSIV